MKAKSLVVVAVATIGMVACAESLFVPTTSDQHLQQYNLREGEIVYKKNNTYFASLIIGNDTKQPYYVSDDRALKCENIYAVLDQTQLSIEKSANVAYDNGTYYVEDRNGPQTPVTTVAEFAISAPAGYIMGSVEFDHTDIDFEGRIGFSGAKFSSSFSENKLILRCELEHGSALKIWNFTGKVKQQSEDLVNDTTLDGTDFAITDTGYTRELKVYGQKATTGKSTYHLSGLRGWVASLYHGNLGVDWSDYPAVKNVEMKDKAILWGDVTKPMVGYQHSAGRLESYIDGNRTMYMVATEQDPISGVSYDDTFVKVTEIQVNPTGDNGHTYITFEYQDLPNVDHTCWGTMYTAHLEKDQVQWVFLTPIEMEVLSTTGNNGIVKIKVNSVTPQSDKQGFWRVRYDKELKETISGGGTAWVKWIPQVIMDSADLIATKDLVIKSPGGKFFTINVDDSGNLSTTEYTKKINLDQY